MSRVLTLPIHGKDPPAAAVVEELKAIDAAGKRFFLRSMTRLVGAPDVSDVVPAFNAIDHWTFVETFFGKKVLGAGGVFIGRDDKRADGSLVVTAAGDHTRAGKIERAEAVPVARRAGGTGDHVINRANNVLDRVNITWPGRWW